MSFTLALAFAWGIPFVAHDGAEEFAHQVSWSSVCARRPERARRTKPKAGTTRKQSPPVDAVSNDKQTEKGVGGNRKAASQARSEPAPRRDGGSNEATANDPVEGLPSRTALPPPPTLSYAYTAVGLAFEAQDTDGALAQEVERALVDEIDELPGMRAITPNDLRAESARFGLSAAACGGEPSCLARVGLYARTHILVHARLAGLGGILALSLRAIDTSTGREIARVAEAVSDEVNTRTQELRRYCVQLLQPQSYTGSLAIAVSEPGAEVFIDDKPIGRSPFGSSQELRAGPHVLRVSMVGFTDVHQFVDVIYRRSSRVTVDMRSNTATTAIVIKRFDPTRIGTLFVASAESDLQIRVDGEPMGRTPLPEPITLAPGMHKISLRRPGVDAHVERIEIRAMRRTDVRVALSEGSLAIVSIDSVDPTSPLPTDAVRKVTLASNAVTAPDDGLRAPVEDASANWRLPLGCVLAGVGMAGMSAATYFNYRVHATSDKRTALEAQALEPMSYAEYGEIQRKLTDEVDPTGERFEKYQWISLAAGGVSFLGAALVVLPEIGLVLRSLFAADETNVPAVRVALQPFGQGGGMFVVSGELSWPAND